MVRRAADHELNEHVVVAASKLAGLQAQARTLPPPRMQGGLPLLDALARRHSTREYDPRPLPPDLLSGLLWAAFGVNRAQTADRTAPYWRHVMAMDIICRDGRWRVALCTGAARVAAATADGSSRADRPAGLRRQGAG